MSRRSSTNDADAAPPKTVIFLGAGASAAECLPKQSELFREYFQSGSIHRRVDQQMKDDLARYFKRLWGIKVDSDLADTKFPTFEEALGILDIADARNESFRGMGGDRHATGTKELRNHLTVLIALILLEKLQEHSRHHVDLVRHLQEQDQLRSVVFVSVNYDTIIDEAIARGSILAGEPRIPYYGVVFGSDPHPEGRLLTGSTLLLKLHGSLNWLFCPACSDLYPFPNPKGLAEQMGDPWRLPCPECHEIGVSTIVPPTFLKVMSNFYLQQIWKRAEKELKKAQRIVFCGYSFPDADIHIRYLVKRAEVNRPEGQDPPEVFIVNEHQSKERHQRDTEKDRYLRFFRRKDQVHWTNLSFQDFAANPRLVEDPTQWL